MLSIIDENGYERFLGNLEPASGLMRSWPIYGDAGVGKVLPRSQWKPIDLSAYTSPVKDQDGVGACNAFATINAAEACRRMAGLPFVKLSTGYLYGSINGQQDRGSMLEDALDWMLQNGTCLASTVPELAWRRGQWPASAATEAKAYRFLEAWTCPTFDHLASAIQMGFFLDLGIMWGNYRPDSEGWLTGGGGGGGHAILGCGLVERSGRWGLLMKNSWGKWGLAKNGDDYGYAVIPEEMFRGPVGGWWAVRSMTDEGAGELPTPHWKN